MTQQMDPRLLRPYAARSTGPIYTKAGQFNGTNTFVNCGTSSSKHVYNKDTPFSMACRFRTTMTGNGAMLNRQSNTTFAGYNIYVQSNVIMFQLAASSSNRIFIQYNGVTVNDGLDHSVVITYDGGGDNNAAGVICYIDGVVATPTIVADSLTIANIGNPLGMGARGGVGNPYDGLLWDCRMADTVWAPGESVPTTGIWLFDEGVGTLINDSSPGSDDTYDGTAANMTWVDL